MKLLFDQNLSFKLWKRFSATTHKPSPPLSGHHLDLPGNSLTPAFSFPLLPFHPVVLWSVVSSQRSVVSGQ